MAEARGSPEGQEASEPLRFNNSPDPKTLRRLSSLAVWLISRKHAADMSIVPQGKLMLHLIRLQGHMGKGPLPLVSKSLMYVYSLSYRTFLGYQSPGKTRFETIVLNMALWESGWASWEEETQPLGNTRLLELLAALLGMDRLLWGLRRAQDKQNHSSLPALCLSFPLRALKRKVLFCHLRSVLCP